MVLLLTSVTVSRFVFRLKLCRTLTMLTPTESGKYISSISKHCSIDDDGITILSQKVYDEIKNGTISISGFHQHKCHPTDMPTEKVINWIFVVDTLNFCFWLPGKDKWEITHQGTKYSGYFGLCAAINKAIEQGIDMTNPKIYSQLKSKDLKQILQGDNPEIELPLLKERLDSLHQVGTILLEKYEGSFVNCIKECNNSAQSLLRLIVSEFTCFKDESQYKGKQVSFYKRAQILIADIWSCLKGTSLGKFNDIDTITMFADYRVPQVLVSFGVLKYTSQLNEKLKSDEILPNGCEEESEIRGCSIEAVERLNRQVLNFIKNDNKTSEFLCNSILIDNFLWDYRRNKQLELEHIPFHKVISIYY